MQLHKILAKDIMVAQPYTIDINEDFAVAWDTFRLRKIRHLPVLINGRLLIGVLSLTDLYRLISPHSTKTGTLIYDVNELNRFKLKDVMTKKVYTVHPDDTLSKVIDTILNNKIGCVPVIDETNYLKGIITRGNVLREVVKYFV